MGDFFIGRRPIYTGVLPESLQFKKYRGDTLNESTMHIVLNKCLKTHMTNAVDIHGLMNYYRGIQRILHRYDGEEADNRLVDNRVVVNYANAFTRNIKSYVYGNPIQYSPNNQDYASDVNVINKAMNAEDKPAVTDMMADYQSVCGTSYIGIMPDLTSEDEVPFELLHLNPENTFRVYSGYNNKRPVFACTYNVCEDLHENRWVTYDVYTDRLHYIYRCPDGAQVERSHLTDVEVNPMGNIPIIEYMNNQFRMGDWEMAISLMDAINSLASDSINDVQQTVLSYLVILGADLTEEILAKARKYKMFSLPGTPGINMDAKFITCQIDGQSASLLRSYLDEALRVVVGIPNRDERTSGGDTGVAAITRTGTPDLEAVAKVKTTFTRMAEQELLRIAINILKTRRLITSDISIRDIDIGFNRCKTDNLLTKTQAGKNLYDMGVDTIDVTAIMNLTTDNVGFNDRWKDNRETMRSEDKAVENGGCGEDESGYNGEGVSDLSKMRAENGG